MLLDQTRLAMALVLITSGLASTQCFLSRQLDACSDNEDCPSGSVCWRNPHADIKVCMPADFAACLDSDVSHQECSRLLDDAGTFDVRNDLDTNDLGADLVDLTSDEDADIDAPERDVLADSADVSDDVGDATDGDLDQTTDGNVDSDADTAPTPPEAVADSYSLVSGPSITVSDPGVLSNDISFGGPLAAERLSETVHGSLTLGAGGGFTYIHDGSQNTTDSFTYRASDDGLLSGSATVTLEINVAPLASNQNLIVPDGDAVTITLQATDANDDDLAFAIVSTPTDGELTSFDAVAGTVDFRPDPDFTGTDTFTFRANDGELDSNEATVTLSVNGAPGFVTLPPTQSALAGSTLGPLQITIGDPDDGPADLTLSAISDRQDIVPDANIGVTGSGADRFLTLITETDQAGVVTLTLELSDASTTVSSDLAIHVGVTHDLDDVALPGSLRRALDIAADGNTISFDPDHFNIAASEAQRTITLQSQLVIDYDVTIQGPGRDLLILSGNNSVRVLFVAAEAVVAVRDLTLTRGNASGGGNDGHGGAIFNDRGQLTVTDSTLADNSALLRGDGIYNDRGDVAVDNCTLFGNFGPAIYNSALGQVTVTASTISGTTSGCSLINSGDLTLSDSVVRENASGVCDSAGTLTVLRTTIADNAGVGLAAETTSLTLVSSSVTGNSGGTSGGGLAVDENSLATVVNCTISGNSAALSGGGIWVHTDSAVSVFSSTIFGNRADSDGSGGGVGGGINNESGVVALHGTIVAANVRGAPEFVTADDITNDVSLDGSSAYNLVGDEATSDVLEDGDVNNNIIGVDWTTVLSSTLIGNGGPTQTHALIAGGPAIDLIPGEDCRDGQGGLLMTDQRGEPRPSGDGCDIGAFERQLADP